MVTGILNRMIEISQIKKEYFEDILSGKIIENKRIQRIILALDEEFLENIQELKFKAGIKSLEELDVNTYPGLIELKSIVEELLEMDEKITKNKSRRKLVIK